MSSRPTTESWTKGLRPFFSIAYTDSSRPFLEGYSVAKLDELHEQIDRMPLGSKARDVLEDLYFSRVQEFQIDDEGRIVLSQSLRDMIGLTGDAIFVGKGNRFEIWAPETYHARRGNRTTDFLRDQGDDFNPLALLQATSEAS